MSGTTVGKHPPKCATGKPYEQRIFFPEGLPDGFANIRSDCRTRILAFYHYLAWRSATNKKSRGGFIPLHHDTLAQRLGRDYRKHLDRLKDVGAIDIDPSYIVGCKSKGYSISENHSLGNITSIVIEAKKPRDYLVSQCVRSLPHRAIFATLNAATIIDTSQPEGLSFLQQVNWLIGADDFVNRRFRYVEDKTTGRVFHSAANLPKELRSRILIDGEASIEIDLANAQPFLMAELYREFRGSERARYEHIVGEGLLYEFIMKETGLDRDATKKALFSSVIFAGGYFKHTPLWKWWSATFPELASRIEAFGQSRLPTMLQMMEAALFITTIAPALQRIGVPALTVHDAVIVPARMGERAKNLMSGIIRRETGRSPRLTTSAYHKNAETPHKCIP